LHSDRLRRNIRRQDGHHVTDSCHLSTVREWKDAYRAWRKNEGAPALLKTYENDAMPHTVLGERPRTGHWQNGIKLRRKSLSQKFLL
jgi:hypothetical protein